MTEKSTSSELTDIMNRLTINQRRFVVACMDYPNKNDAAKAIGIQPNTVYKWPEEVDRAIHLLSLDMVSGAKALRLQALAKAMMVKVKGLDSGDERIRQSSATELIEWELGKAQQHTDVTTLGDKIFVTLKGEDDD
jgi:hypothetical protein